MAKREALTDLWVAGQLQDSDIDFTPQGSNNVEINEALKSASKRGTGYAGFPEFVAIVNDYVLIIEDKADLNKHIKLTDSGILDTSIDAITDYAVNGAYFYAKHVAQNTYFKKVFAIGVSGNEKNHKITPLWVDDRESYKQLPDLESFFSFSSQNIQEYYIRNVLDEPTSIEKSTSQILKDAAELHEHLRNYGALKDQDKPLVVAGILLALDEIKYGNFSIDSLKGDQNHESLDGVKIINAIKSRLTRSNVSPEDKKDKILSEFDFIKNSFRLNEINEKLEKTPLRYFTEFLYNNVFKSIKYQDTSEDFIGRFYGEFMSYSGGDGQTLGIILTPKHICDLMCELIDVKPDDTILDPTCGTAGFLISAMHRMLTLTDSEGKKKNIKKKQLHGYEIQSNMFTVAAANMILRKDGKSNLESCDFLQENPAKVQLKGATVGLMNPPYSQGSKENPNQYELSFIEHLLDSLTEGARAAVIVPQSSMTGKTRIEKDYKESILKKHTLEGVITCNFDTFHGVGTQPVIAIFTANEPHPEDKESKFINFQDDGYEIHKHIGLLEGKTAKDKRKHLLDVWNKDIEVPTKFCVKSPVAAEDEWLHSFFYFNDEIPSEDELEQTINEFLTFQFSLIVQGKDYLFKNIDEINNLDKIKEIIPLEEKKWEPFLFKDLFNIEYSTAYHLNRLKDVENKNDKTISYISRKKFNNGYNKQVLLLSNFDTNPARTISFGAENANFFYQPFEYITGNKMYYIETSHLSLFVNLFLTMVFEHSFSSNFSYGNGMIPKRIENKQILLPVNSSNEPDYEYMEQYVKNLIIKKYNKYLKYIDN